MNKIMIMSVWISLPFIMIYAYKTGPHVMFAWIIGVAVGSLTMYTILTSP